MILTNPNSCFGYIRVSTAKQGEGVSLMAQKEAIQSFAERNALIVTKWFEETETAAKSGRPIFLSMIKQLNKGGARNLVIHKIDRSARNLADWAKIGELSDAGINIHFATESLDFRSRGGRLTADIQAVIAADYIRNLREETIKGLNGRLKQGYYPWRSPVGYVDNGGGEVKTINPKTGPLVRKLFELYASGAHSIRSLVIEMRKQGLVNKNGGPITKTGIETILANPFYIGLIYVKRHNQTHKGNHKSLISTQLFNMVQDMKLGRYRKKKTKHFFKYRGVFNCKNCKRSMIPSTQKGHVYYRCQVIDCPTNCVRETQIESQLFNTLRTYDFDPQAIALLEKRLHQWLNQKVKLETPNTMPMELAKVDRQKAKLTDALLDDLIDKQIHQDRMKQLLIQETELLEKQKKTANPRYIEQRITKALELFKSPILSHSLANSEEKAQMVKSLFSNLEIANKNVEVKPRNWLLKTDKLLNVLGGGQQRTTSLSGNRLGLDPIEQLLEITNCLEFQRLLQIVGDANLKNQPLKLPKYETA